MTLLRSDPNQQNNFLFTLTGKPKYLAILACLNDIVLLDWRRLIGGSLLTEGNRNHPWIVYNATDTKYFGEWQGFKTRREAIEWFIKRALSSPVSPLCNMVVNTPVELALRQRATRYELPTNQLHTYGLTPTTKP